MKEHPEKLEAMLFSFYWRVSKSPADHHMATTTLSQIMSNEKSKRTTNTVTLL